MKGNRTSTRTEKRAAVRYSLRMPEPHTHYFEVEVSIERRGARPTDFVLPVWTPGSYMIREFSQHLESFRATDGDGRPLEWTKVEKNRWRVTGTGGRRIVVGYRVYAFDASVRTPYLDGDHAVVNGAGLFAYPEGYENEEIELRLEPPRGFTSVSTALAPAKGDPWTLHAPDYDTLVDSPIEIGSHPSYRFDVRGIPHEVAIFGRGNVDPERLVADTRRIVETSAALFRGLPYRRYVFIFHLLPTASGGLEHHDSSLMQFPRFGFKPDADYQRQLALIAHEFFHVWNVKRIRPAPLGRFDYTRENYTRLLWVAEGFTSYYQEVILRRAGLQSGEDFLAALARLARIASEFPGSRVQSLEESSFDAWIKFYRPNENAKNSRISYYVKGCVVALLLDLEIRRRTRGRRSLDDVMRGLKRRCDKSPEGVYTEGDVRELVAEVAVGELDSLIDGGVQTTEPLDLAPALRAFGLDMGTCLVTEEPARGFLGILVASDHGRAIVQTVLLDTPASLAGLSARDELIAVDDFRVDEASCRQRIEERAPGERVTLTVARQDVLRTVEATLDAAPRSDFAFIKRDDATDAERALYEEWVQEAFDTPPRPIQPTLRDPDPRPL